MSLCDTCVESFRWSAARKQGSNMEVRYHHRTHMDWLLSVQQRCNICMFLYDTLFPAVAAQLKALDDGLMKRMELSKEESIQGFLRWAAIPILEDCDSPVIGIGVDMGYPGFEFPERGSGHVQIVQTDSVNGPVASRQALLDSLGSSTDSEAAWRLMRGWISTCIDKHIDYGTRRQEGGTWYPTRLLDLGDQEPKTAPRLIHTASTAPYGPYLTLSHCWGKANHICALRNNLENLEVGVHGLPKTFEHAVAATRKLGYRYLWIDSLCILQDDHQDWAHESALMHKVYTNAACNLAAAASEDSGGGLFFDRRGIYGQCVAQYTGENGIDSYVDRGLFERAVHGAPLQQRAWVHQEWLMAQRTIHFAKDQVFWECDHLCACEVFPHGFPDCVSFGKKQTLIKSLTENHSTPELTDIRQYHLWANFVYDYTTRELTKASDRLPALSGIAKWIQPFLGNPIYLSGLWNNASIHLQLAWWVSLPKSPRPPYRAPSWSWASVEGIVVSNDWPARFTPGMDILAASTTCEGSDLTGAVSGGYLMVRGNLSRVNIAEDGTFTRSNDVRSTQEPSHTDLNPLGLSETGPIALEEGPVNAVPEVFFPGFDATDMEFGEYYIIPLLKSVEPTRKSAGRSGTQDFRDTYLVLKVVSGQNGVFERCGIVHEFYTEVSRHQRALVPRVSAYQQDLPYEEYIDPEEGYKILII